MYTEQEYKEALKLKREYLETGIDKEDVIGVFEVLASTGEGLSQRVSRVIKLLISEWDTIK